MSGHSITTGAALAVWLLGSSLSRLAAAPAPGHEASAGSSGAAASALAPDPSQPRVNISFYVANHWHRLDLNGVATVVFEATGAVEGTNQVQFLWDHQVVATYTVVGSRPWSDIFHFAPPDPSQPVRAREVFYTTPRTAGQHELALKLTTAQGEVFTAGPLVVEVAHLQRPTLRVWEQPPAHLWTTQAFNLVLEATTFEGKETLILCDGGGFGDLIVTNGPLLALRNWKLRPGIHDVEVSAKDDHNLFSEPLRFTCTVEPVEQAGTPAPGKVTFAPARLPTQLQLAWELPTQGVRPVGTLIQRLDPGAQDWKTVAVVAAGIREWRDRELPMAHYYKYRIAFLCDDVSRTPFGPEAGKSTGF